MQHDLERVGHALTFTLVTRAEDASITALPAPERLREQAEAAQAFAEAQHAPSPRPTSPDRTRASWGSEDEC